MRIILFIFVIALTSPLVAQEGWSVEKMMQVAQPSSVTVSPDGNEAIIEVDGTLAHTRGALGNCRGWAPSYSPNGEWVAFLSDDSGHSQLYLIHRRGGQRRQLTWMEGGVGAFKWSPSGEQIAFLSQECCEQPEVIDGDELERHGGEELWLLSFRSKSGPRKLTEWKVAYPLGGMIPFDWSPDGREISFATWLDFGAEIDAPEMGLARVDLRTWQTELWGIGVVPRYSPDGEWIAFLRMPSPSKWDDTQWVSLLSRRSGEIVDLMPTEEEGEISFLEWNALSDALYLVEPRSFFNGLYLLPICGGEPYPIGDGRTYFRTIELNRGRTHFGLVIEGPEQLPEGYMTRVDSFDPLCISHFNEQMEGIPTGQTVALAWESADGEKIEGLLTLPCGYQGGYVPLLLMIHGGPHCNFTLNSIANPHPYPVAAFADAGFAVLRPNPRGSSGYGREFRHAIDGDWGGIDFMDVMSGVDHLIDLGIADPERLGVMGWSYGGYLTAWSITQTDRFAAASFGAAMTHLVSWAGTSTLGRVARGSLGDGYWIDDALYRERSPLTHVANVTTPCLIHHGVWDQRVPFGQGHEFYRALRAMGNDAEFLVYPTSAHSPGSYKANYECMQRNVDWFSRRLPIALPL